MIKNFTLIVALVFLVGCEAVKQKTENFKKPGDTCPPKEERTLKDIFCKEAK